MFQVFRRVALFRRRWVWGLLLLGALGFAGYWMVPWRGGDAHLQLVALRADGVFAQTVRAGPLESATADADDPEARDGLNGARPDDGGARAVAPAAPHRGVPLVLAVANLGQSGARPDRLVLTMPRWYRLIDAGPRVTRELVPDEPLQRYVVDVDFPTIEGGRVPTILPGIDTLWLEPWVPDYYCTADVDSVPQLMASTEPAAEGLVALRIFYSFEGVELLQRQTGLLTVEVPGEMFERSGPSDITASPVQLQLPRAERPPMGELASGGSRVADCGPPGDPMRIYSALWLTPEGGRMISVHYGGQPRKEYYDLNRDSIIELEMWDPDGDGELEAWRRLDVPIPEYLLPEPLPVALVADSAAFDSLGADSTLFAVGDARASGATGAPGAPGAGATGLAALGRLLIPGDLASARRLFTRPPAPGPAPGPDGLLGDPLGGVAEPRAPGAELFGQPSEGELPAAETPAEQPAAEPETPEPEVEPTPPPPRKVPIGEPLR